MNNKRYCRDTDDRVAEKPEIIIWEASISKINKLLEFININPISTVRDK